MKYTENRFSGKFRYSSNVRKLHDNHTSTIRKEEKTYVWYRIIDVM